MNRIQRARTMNVALPSAVATYSMKYKDEGIVQVPTIINRNTYRNRRDRGMSHEEAVSKGPLMPHAAAADLKELRLPGSRPRRRHGDSLRAWQAKRGKETPDQLAALAKWGVA